MEQPKISKNPRGCEGTQNLETILVYDLNGEDRKPFVATVEGALRVHASPL
jgi:hypothetical protein